MKVKLICGFRDNEQYTIDAEEVHKAYYLFRNPEKRGVFDNGLGLEGKDIKRIVPDYHATMGWNSTHKLEDDDWNELNGKGVVDKLKEKMGNGSLIAYQIESNPALLNMKLSDIPMIAAPSSKMSLDQLTEGINKL